MAFSVSLPLTLTGFENTDDARVGIVPSVV